MNRGWMTISHIDFCMYLHQHNGLHLRRTGGDRACAVAGRPTLRGWPLAANPRRALRKCFVVLRPALLALSPDSEPSSVFELSMCCHLGLLAWAGEMPLND